jgi:predicted RNase H-like HicB family nuclease
MTPKANFILIRPLDNDEGFLAYAIGLDGCVVEGRTEEETLANIKEAIAGWRRPEPELHAIAC